MIKYALFRSFLLKKRRFCSNSDISQKKNRRRPHTGTQPKFIFTRNADFDACCIQILDYYYTYWIILAYLIIFILFYYISLLYTYLFNYNSLLPIAYCLLPIAYCLLPTAYCRGLLPILSIPIPILRVLYCPPRDVRSSRCSRPCSPCHCTFGSGGK